MTRTGLEDIYIVYLIEWWCPKSKSNQLKVKTSTCRKWNCKSVLKSPATLYLSYEPLIHRVWWCIFSINDSVLKKKKKKIYSSSSYVLYSNISILIFWETLPKIWFNYTSFIHKTQCLLLFIVYTIVFQISAKSTV